MSVPAVITIGEEGGGVILGPMNYIVMERRILHWSDCGGKMYHKASLHTLHGYLPLFLLTHQTHNFVSIIISAFSYAA